MPKLHEIPEVDGFDKLLEDAEKNASDGWETNFVSETKERYQKYGDNTYISEKQAAIIKKIAQKTKGSSTQGK